MTIACLGWGSLIWDPRDLPLAGDWKNDGPELPLEFARQSADGRMTLVVVHHDEPVPTLWAPLAVSNLGAGIEALGMREGVTILGAIGRTPHHDPADYISDQVAAWAKRKGLVGVVWTNLKPGFVGKRGQVPTLEEIRRYIDTMSPDARVRATKYVEAAPLQIRTPYRGALLEALRHPLGSWPD